MHKTAIATHLPWLLALLATPAAAATYDVGAGRTYPTLPALFSVIDLEPGDIVEVQGGQTYAGDIVMPAADGGAPGNPVVLRGIRVDGARPLLLGGTNTIEFRLADHVVFEGFEVAGTTSPVNTFRCVYHHSHDLTIRDALIRDCPRHGVLGADQDSGSLTIEYSEIRNSGSGDRNHLVYMATDEVAHPGAVFRLQHSYLHSATGGNLIKSRAERNEIYYNWLEGGFYHELELIGPDPAGAQDGWSEDLVREDSDVVGNMILHTSDFGAVIRLGGDGTGQSHGRYRFVNNTIVRVHANDDTPTIFRLFDGIESVEMHNNVIHRDGTSAMRLIREVEADWVGSVSRITGTNNWFDDGATFVPGGWSGNLGGSDPGLIDLAAGDLRPANGSPLLDVAGSNTVTAPDYDIATPLFPPRFEPPLRQAPTPGVARTRATDGALDIGAFEKPDAALIFRDGFGER